MSRGQILGQLVRFMMGFGGFFLIASIGLPPRHSLVLVALGAAGLSAGFRVIAIAAFFKNRSR